MKYLPKGSNADEWHLFLANYLDARANFPRALGAIAIEISEAIDRARIEGKSAAYRDLTNPPEKKS